jgi:hypothetical protein
MVLGNEGNAHLSLYYRSILFIPKCLRELALNRPGKYVIIIAVNLQRTATTCNANQYLNRKQIYYGNCTLINGKKHKPFEWPNNELYNVRKFLYQE